MMVENVQDVRARELTTTSRLKTWYMVQFKGYTVVQRREVPRVTTLGRLTYDSLWQLRAPEGSGNGEGLSREGSKPGR